MEEKKDKLSMFQIISMYILVLTAPGVRTFFTSVVSNAKKASWISPFIATLPIILLVLMLNKLMSIKKERSLNLVEIFDAVYGKILGFVISMIYLIWIILTGGIETRLFAERLISASYIYTPIKFFLITVLLLVLYAARSKISNFGKFTEIVFELFIGIVAFVFITSMQNVEVTNLWPPEDIKKIFIGAFDSLNLLSFITFSLFLGEKIEDREKFKKMGIIGAVVAIIISILGIIVTLGTFGEDLLPTFSQPFFMTVKAIGLFGVLERIEAIFITFWVAMDFIMIAYIVIIASQICKYKFNLKERKLAVNPIILIIYILSLLAANNYFSMQTFARDIALPTNLLFGFIIPTITFIVAKIKRIV